MKKHKKMIAGAIGLSMSAGVAAMAQNVDLGNSFGDTIGGYQWHTVAGGMYNESTGGQGSLNGSRYLVGNVLDYYTQAYSNYYGELPVDQLTVANLQAYLENGTTPWGLEASSNSFIANGISVAASSDPAEVDHNTALGEHNVVGQLASGSSALGNWNTIAGGTPGYFTEDLNPVDVLADGAAPLWTGPTVQFGATAVGAWNTIGSNASLATAIGYYNQVDANALGATAIGANNRAQGVNSIVIGNGANAVSAGSIAIGAGAVAQSSVAMGGAGTGN
jgi:hypothetical protein